MPSISEDEHAGEADEPPDHPLYSFHKTTPSVQARRSSLLTKALHTDSESHDESLGFSSAFRRQTSRSSTCSTWSFRTDHTSDDAHTSSPSSPSKPITFHTPAYESQLNNKKSAAAVDGHDSNLTRSVSPGEMSEPVVEERLGRKRCITFACGRQKAEESKPMSRSPEPWKTEEQVATPQKRPCALKFICPSKVSSSRPEAVRRASRHLSPPPPSRPKSASPNSPSSRSHRGSDTTIKNDSPKTARKVPPMEPRMAIPTEADEDNSEATRFHEFAGVEEKPDDWVQESTCHRSRLTVDDTLEKEKTIRQIGEEAEEEALEEEEAEDALSGPVDSDDDISDEGFQTDDEQGFAESDDESDDGSDYEWWAPNRSSPVEATMAPGDALRLPAMHHGSTSSLSSIVSPKQSQDLKVSLRTKKKNKTKAITFRPSSPELPDSTDFVCGTLDEDKPLEEAYMSCLEQRRAAQHRPQDIDPTLPDDAIELDEDEDEDADTDIEVREDESESPVHGGMDGIDGPAEDDEEPRGRRREPKPKPSPRLSPLRLQSNTPRTASIKRIKSPMPGLKQSVKRLKSPMPTSANSSVRPPKPSTQRKGYRLRSPPPRALFGHSPMRVRSPAPPTQLKSPPPSRRSSPSSVKPVPFGTAFLGQRPQLTHTTSLPRSPNPFAYKRAPFTPPTLQEVDVDDVDDGEDTAKENKTGYTRGAVDIVQGLERKRLRRRQKFYEKYCRKEEKKRERGEVKRPPPGKGAQRMRQVGIECAVYRGKRVLSV